MEGGNLCVVLELVKILQLLSVDSLTMLQVCFVPAVKNLKIVPFRTCGY